MFEPSFNHPGHQIEPIGHFGGAHLVGRAIDLLGDRVDSQSGPEFGVRSGVDKWLDPTHLCGLQLLDESEYRVQARQSLVRFVGINREPGKLGESLDIVAGEHRECGRGGSEVYGMIRGSTVREPVGMRVSRPNPLPSLA